MSLFDISSLWKAAPTPANLKSQNVEDKDFVDTTKSVSKEPSNTTTVSASPNTENTQKATEDVLPRVCITDDIKENSDEEKNSQGEAEMELDVVPDVTCFEDSQASAKGPDVQKVINNLPKASEDFLAEWDKECSRICDETYVDDSEVLEQLVDEVLARSYQNEEIKQPLSLSEESIRNRAYHIWLETGCSDEIANYFKAEAELLSQA